MERLGAEAVTTFLGHTALLKACPSNVLAKLAPHVEQKEVPWGHLLVQPGLPVTGIGFLFSGKASVRFVEGAGADAPVMTIEPGQSFGEVALMLGGPSAVSIMAEEDCIVLSLRREHFEQVMNVVAPVGQAVAKTLAEQVLKLGASQTAVAPTAASPGVIDFPGAGAPAASAVPEPAAAAPSNMVRFVETAAFNITPKVLEMVPQRTIYQHRVLPLEIHGRNLVVGMVNPAASEVKSELRRVLQNVDAEFVAISIDDFQSAVLRLKIESPEMALQRQSGASRNRPKVIYAAEHRREVEKAHGGGGGTGGEEAKDLLDRVLVEASERGASDIHIEPEANGVRIRYRIQGVMTDRGEPVSLNVATGLTARIKVLAELDITERRIPQDGRIGATVGTREFNYRVSTLASVRGEKIVMRILDPSEVMRPLEQILLDPATLEMASRAIAVPHGAVVVAGPTGAGKSSTLYSMVNRRRIARPDNNIITVEDPVEYTFPGITQTPLNPKIGLDYPTVLRAMMRQDPDVIMIGELRDATSSGIAVEAALTGHMVLTTIHGSTAVAVLQRLGHFDIPPVLLSQALNIVIVQRLAPKLCQNCVKDDEVSGAMLDNLRALHLVDGTGTTRLPRAVGCEACDRTGRRGRVAVVEVLSLTDDMRVTLAQGIPPAEMLDRAARSGQFLSFSNYARKLMAKRLLAPADAMQVVAA